MGTFDNYDELAYGVANQTYELAKERNQNPVKIPHLFFVLLNQPNNEIAELLGQSKINVEALREQAKKSLMGILSLHTTFSVAPELHSIFDNANAIAQGMGDKNVSIYHLFLSLLQSENTVSKALKEQ